MVAHQRCVSQKQGAHSVGCHQARWSSLVSPSPDDEVCQDSALKGTGFVMETTLKLGAFTKQLN
jgi:hypothetical protein